MGAWIRQQSPKLKGDFPPSRDIQSLPDQPEHLYAAHVINDLWKEKLTAKPLVVTDVGPAPDVGSAVLSPQSPAYASSLPAASAPWVFCASRRHRRKNSPNPIGKSGVRRRRWRIPDDHERAPPLSSQEKINIKIAIINKRLFSAWFRAVAGIFL